LGAPPGTASPRPPPRPPGPSPVRVGAPEPAEAKLPDFEAPDTSNGEDADGATIIRQSPFLVAEMARAVKDRGALAPPAPASRASVPRIVPPARASIRSAPPPAGGPGLDVSIPSHSTSAPGLYSGFQNAVAAAPAQSSPSQQLPTEDWYVGVGGVPLGPVRLSVIRDKAAAGQVDRDSLVWREGFDEWQPVRAFGPLLALIEEAKASRLSRGGMAAVSHTPSGTTPAPIGATPAPRQSISGPFAQIPDAAPSLPFDLVRGSTPLPPGATPFGVSTPGASPHAPLAGVAASAPLIALAPETSAGAGANGFGLTTTQGTALSGPAPIGHPAASAGPASIPPASLKKKRGLHPMAWAMIAMAAAFGGVAAWALLFRDSGTEIRYVEKTATATEPALGAAPPAPPTGEAASADTAEPAASTNTSPTGGPVAVKNGNGSTTAPTAKSGDTAPPIDTSGFGSGVTGPTATGTSDNGGSGGTLSEGEINGVVARGKPGITRRCWTPAYDARPNDAPKSAKVNASVKIGPSGSVQSVSASGGGSGYPSLASCVQGSIKSWQFPPSDGGATVNIPFVFSGQ